MFRSNIAHLKFKESQVQVQMSLKRYFSFTFLLLLYFVNLVDVWKCRSSGQPVVDACGSTQTPLGSAVPLEWEVGGRIGKTCEQLSILGLADRHTVTRPLSQEESPIRFTHNLLVYWLLLLQYVVSKVQSCGFYSENFNEMVLKCSSMGHIETDA